MPSCGVCPSVCLSICLSRSWIMSKRINISLNFFSPLSSHIILVFPYQTEWRYSDGNPPNGSVECRWGRQKTRVRTNIWLYWTCVYRWLQHMYRVTLIGVFFGYFPINLHQTRMQYSNEGPQHWNATQFPKKRFLNVEFCRRKNSCSHFSSLCQQQICSGVKNQ